MERIREDYKVIAEMHERDRLKKEFKLFEKGDGISEIPKTSTITFQGTADLIAKLPDFGDIIAQDYYNLIRQLIQVHLKGQQSNNDLFNEIQFKLNNVAFQEHINILKKALMIYEQNKRENTLVNGIKLSRKI